jgi:serine/threonine-protein kinase
LYAVGVVGYEALTGRRAYPQENMAELARAIAAAAPPPLAALRPDVDPALASVIERAMASDPSWRFGSADEMRAALAGRITAPVRPPTRVLATPLPPPSTVMVAPPRRNRSRWLLLMAAVIAVLAVAVAFIVDSASRPAVPEPVTTSTSVPPPTTSFVPPPPPTTPVLVDEPPPKKRGGNGNGNGHKKGGD